ncbi:MAG: hypothetical protein H0T51_19795, partial [Pirellulales bacterium]|nr:hypothetical protein [Pirellulales bacterium]
MASLRLAALFAALTMLASSRPAEAQVVVPSEWNTGNGNWNVAGNWFPNDVPDDGGGFTYDVQIGNRPVAAGAGVFFIPEDGTGDTVSSLSISGAADLFTNGFQVFVMGQTTVSGVGSTIRIDQHATPGAFSLDTDDLDLNGGGSIQMNGGIVNVDVLLEINVAGQIQGNGVVDVGDGDAVVEQALENSGAIRPTSGTSTPQTLTIQTNGVDTIDLDGDTETGVVDADDVSANVNADTLTLVIDAPLSDAFSGTLQIGQRDTVTFVRNFTLSGADVAMNGGAQVATLNGAGDATSIAASAFTIAGSATIANDMTFVGTANTVTTANGSTLTLSGTVAVADASMFVFGQNSFFVVSAATTIIEGTGDFNWDGGGAVTTTVQGAGHLSILVDQIDNNATDSFNGTVNLNDDGDVTVNNLAGSWDLVGALNKNGAGTSVVSGDRVVVTGDINVSAGTLDMPA